MALEGEQEGNPVGTKAIPSPKDGVRVVSQASSCQPDDQPDSSSPKKTLTSREFILSVARKYSAQPLQNSDPGVWGVLTAISTSARKRPQGINILLTADEHCIGRLVEDTCFRVEDTSVSGKHCKIYRKRITSEDVEQASSFCTSVLLEDTSTNGTYLNWEKLKRNGTGAELRHGDIVSLAAVPQHRLAVAFVYREVPNSTPLMEGTTFKRKAEGFVSESKRLKGIGIGAPEGPISLDDVRSLQRSNMELRKQLESHVLSIETMHGENRAVVARHENEMKELKESISQSYLDEIKELKCMLEVKQNELVEVSTISTERQQAMEDLNKRLSASLQSRIDADELINIQKATISELERKLDEERSQRREEREKALADQKAALQRAHSEAQEELKRQSDIASRQENELKEVISKLQESDKESRLLLEALRSKLEGTRESLFISEKKVRQLEAQVREEQQVSANGRKKVEALEYEMKRLRKELEGEKVAREEAWAKVSALELEMAAAIRDLSIEKQRFQGARERIILRESQLRAFYSTTEEISSLFARQQEQLKAMQKTLEDEENYENTSVDIDPNAVNRNTNEAMAAQQSNNKLKESSAASSPKVDRIQVESTSDETEKHNCDLRSQEEGHNTQDMECTSANHSVKGGFGSDIDGVGTAPVLEGDPIGTERVLGTESPAIDANFHEGGIDLNKSSTLAGDTMPLGDEAQVQENEGIQMVHEESARCSQSNNPLEFVKAIEDTEAAGTIRTADLLTSEVAGSWAVSTAPSVHGENESPRSGDSNSDGSDDVAADALLCISQGQAAESQIAPSAVAATKLRRQRLALNEMIKIVAPDLEEQFGDGGLSKEGDNDEASISDSDTKGSNHDSDAEDGSASGTDTQEGSELGENGNGVDAMNESDDDRQEDSLG